MKVSPDVDRPLLGLRERKKVKTRAAIREHALRLFRLQGYHVTTVEQIAGAAEVSPSTFFRYFPTKEDVVMQDDFDALLVEAFDAQPADLSPIQALRRAMRDIFSAVPAEALAQEWERHALIRAVPELRAAMLDDLSRTVQLLAEIVARRVGLRPDDLAVRTFAGAIIGVGMAMMVTASEIPSADYFALFDDSLAYLEAGLPLHPRRP